MKKELIRELFEKFERACYIYKDIECWSARELQELFNYAEWRNFYKVIDKAKVACLNVGEKVQDHFVDINKMVFLGSGSERSVDDIALTRYACYLMMLPGSPRVKSFRVLRKSFRVSSISGAWITEGLR